MAASKKNYVAMAKVFQEAFKQADEGNLDAPTVGWFMDKLADQFQDDNPRFDRARFIDACKQDRD